MKCRRDKCQNNAVPYGLFCCLRCQRLDMMERGSAEIDYDKAQYERLGNYGQVKTETPTVEGGGENGDSGRGSGNNSKE